MSNTPLVQVVLGLLEHVLDAGGFDPQDMYRASVEPSAMLVFLDEFDLLPLATHPDVSAVINERRRATRPIAKDAPQLPSLYEVITERGGTIDDVRLAVDDVTAVVKDLRAHLARNA